MTDVIHDCLKKNDSFLDQKHPIQRPKNTLFPKSLVQLVHKFPVQSGFPRGYTSKNSKIDQNRILTTPQHVIIQTANNAYQLKTKLDLISFYGGAAGWPVKQTNLWCRLVSQAVQTLNMLRISRINPKLSAHDQVFGVFDYNRTPLAPLGTKFVIHERPTQRASWGNHGKEGWLIGPAMHHYRHYTVIIRDTGGKRVSDTIEFLPMTFVMPTMTADDRVIMALEDIAIAITGTSLPQQTILSGPLMTSLHQLVLRHRLSPLQSPFKSPSQSSSLCAFQGCKRQSHRRLPPPRLALHKNSRIPPEQKS